ncbi:hypothetical protein, partial [uncultured Bilophila sp.]|uniref:hypothetical protein n=1 Tax=uncultured Bilophila sp. TaxID=529385 RepID=UPI00261E6072
MPASLDMFHLHLLSDFPPEPDLKRGKNRSPRCFQGIPSPDVSTSPYGMEKHQRGPDREAKARLAPASESLGR